MAAVVNSAAAAAPSSNYVGVGTNHHDRSRLVPNIPIRFWKRTRTRVVAMAPKKKVNKYDSSWKKQWYGAGIFVEGSEDVEVDVFKKLEKRRVLSNVEKAGLLSKAENLGLTLSSIESLRLFSKAEDLRLLSFLDNAASASPSLLASASLPLLLAALAPLLLIPDDSTALLILQDLLAAALAIAAAGLFLGSFLLRALQETD